MQVGLLFLWTALVQPCQWHSTALLQQAPLQREKSQLKMARQQLSKDCCSLKKHRFEVLAASALAAQTCRRGHHHSRPAVLL